MKDFLPFLLALVFLGFKLYSKSKKKQAQQIPPIPQPSENYEEKTPSLDDFIGQFFGNDSEQFSEPEFTNEEYVQDEKNSWMEEMHEQEPESIEYMDTTTVNDKDEIQFEMIQNKPLENMERIDFDLKKAIIYDAIINPPYL
jgi:protein-tyrosine phosphatase